MERLTPDEETRKKLETTLPLQRYGTPADVAELALWLVSSSASYVTGSIMYVDGGLSLIGFHGMMPG
jgi:NAD(P)-dependent dehydrogenase (short-subunit alcohol dehydrogenase family)